MEARILRETLIRHRWNKSRAARELGLSRVGLRGKLDRYGLEPFGVGAQAPGLILAARMAGSNQECRQS
ncbi:MAG: helix-turn-helix domain-containing protein [Candidatus Sedimenticola endophacoides]